MNTSINLLITTMAACAFLVLGCNEPEGSSNGSIGGVGTGNGTNDDGNSSEEPPPGMFSVGNLNGGDGDGEDVRDPENDRDDEPLGTSGDLSCSGIFDCYYSCDENDHDCYDRCYDEGTLTAQDQVWAYYDCWEETGCQDWQCMEQECSSAFNDCFGGGDQTWSEDPGDLKCYEIIDCFNRCGADDQSCYEDCIFQGTEAAQDALFQLVDCMNAAGCQDDACVESQCGQEVATCFE